MFVRIQTPDDSPILDQLKAYDSIEKLTKVRDEREETLYAITWDSSSNLVTEGIAGVDGEILNVRWVDRSCHLSLRFPSHEMLASFETFCDENDIDLEKVNIYTRTNPDAGPYFGLTEPQRETLKLAVTEQYYSIPRERSTKELAEELGISDQAVTERLRRAIVTLATNTIIEAENARSNHRDRT